MTDDENDPELGLSPRVRGNQIIGPGVWFSARSIPACAGEPTAAPAYPPAQEVYPRVCGGTSGSSGGDDYIDGLSPRVRGNPLGTIGAGSYRRSIPACAGEPGADFAPACPAWVYPRVCGGT